MRCGSLAVIAGIDLRARILGGVGPGSGGVIGRLGRIDWLLDCCYCIVVGVVECAGPIHALAEVCRTEARAEDVVLAACTGAETRCTWLKGFKGRLNPLSSVLQTAYILHAFPIDCVDLLCYPSTYNERSLDTAPCRYSWPDSLGDKIVTAGVTARTPFGRVADALWTRVEYGRML